MSRIQQIADVIRTEQARELDASKAEVLRWSVWMAWGNEGPAGMSSREFADDCETLGIRRNTATNRYSEARRNWEAMNA